MKGFMLHLFPRSKGIQSLLKLNLPNETISTLQTLNFFNINQRKAGGSVNQEKSLRLLLQYF